MPITALFAALLVPIYLILTLRVIMLRGAVRVGVGDGGDKQLLRRMRVHANFAETVPFALVLMGLAEGLRASPTALYAAGGGLLLGRILHAYGVSQANETLAFRIAGMVLTLAAIVSLAVACLMLVAGR